VGLEIAWLESPVDAFFIHVQGSARLRLPDGEISRISFDGKSGHPYTSIGRVAVERGILALEAADKDGLERWLKAHPDDAAALMRENRSFIFFKESALAEDDGPLGRGRNSPGGRAEPRGRPNPPHVPYADLGGSAFFGNRGPIRPFSAVDDRARHGLGDHRPGAR
jgi:hypothetical protein